MPTAVWILIVLFAILILLIVVNSIFRKKLPPK